MQLGREEVAGARGRARRARARPPGREEDDRGGEVGWANSVGPPGGWASGKRQVSPSLSLFYFYLIFFSIFCSLF